MDEREIQMRMFCLDLASKSGVQGSEVHKLAAEFLAFIKSEVK